MLVDYFVDWAYRYYGVLTAGFQDRVGAASERRGVFVLLHTIVDKLRVCNRPTLAHGYAQTGRPERQAAKRGEATYAGAVR
jgi:hypothetical protein